MKKYIITVNGTPYEVQVEEIADGAAAQHPFPQPAPPISESAQTYMPAQPAYPQFAQPAQPAYAPLPAQPTVAALPTQPARPQPAQPVRQPAPAPQGAPAPVGDASGNLTQITSPMPGTILKINVAAGDAVKRNQPVIALEAMKMENDITSPVDGTVVAVHVSKNAAVNTGDLLISIG